MAEADSCRDHSHVHLCGSQQGGLNLSVDPWLDWRTQAESGSGRSNGTGIAPITSKAGRIAGKTSRSSGKTRRNAKIMPKESTEQRKARVPKIIANRKR